MENSDYTYDLAILYADDHHDTRESFSEYLKLLFKKVYVVSNALEGIEQFKQNYNAYTNPIDLVITDVDMGNMSGLEMIKELRTYNADLHAVILSGIDMGQYILQINDISILNTYIKKPVNENTFEKYCYKITQNIAQGKFYKQEYHLTQQYRNALDNSSAISKTDLNGNITYVNDAFCEITGYTKDELLGKKHSIIKAPANKKEIFEDLWKTITAKMIWKYDSLANRKKDGSIYYVNTTIMPILNNDGNILEYISIRFDTTKLHESILAEKRAKETQAMFLANMSHEIRTPLNGILGFLDLLKDFDSLSKEIVIEYIEMIDTSSHSLLEIINSILDITKVQTGQIQIESIWFDLYDELKQIQQLYSAKAYEKKIDFNFIDTTSLLKNICVYSDKTKIRGVVSNLVNNAIKFTGQNGTIQLSTQLISKDNENVSIKILVEDNGIGIAKEKQSQIFQPFTQENQSTTRKYGGTGLGLTISYELLKYLGTTLELESTKGEGSCFYFTIDLKYSQEKKHCTHNHSGKNITKHYKGNILIAEDVIINQKLIKAVFDKQGLQTTIVSNGLEAVEEFQQNFHKYDIVILDINMPIMDGVTALYHLKKFQQSHHLHIPVIALTANVIKGDKKRFLDEGFDGYLEKPLQIDKINKMLDSYLDIAFYSVYEKKSKTDEIDSNQTQQLSIDFKICANSAGIPFEFYEELLRDLIVLYNNDFPLLVNSIHNGNKEMLKDKAHKFKGACLNLCIDPLQKLFKSLEESSLSVNEQQKIVTQIQNIFTKSDLKNY
jgi:PAS domain S-box-containing protein